MSVSQPPKTDKPGFDRWLFLFWKLVTAGSATTVVADNTVRPVTLGGTGKSSLTGYLRGNGTSAFSTVTTIPYTDISGAPIPASLNAQLTALSNTTGTGLYAITAFGSSATRTLTGTANRLTVTNGDGVSGNPTADISTSYAGQATIVTLGTVTTGAWNAGAVTSSGNLVVAGTQNAFGTTSTLALLNINTAFSNGSTVQALRFNPVLTPGNNLAVFGILSGATFGSGTENITNAVSIYSQIIKGNSGTISNAIGYEYFGDSVACTTHYGILVRALSGGTTNNYGVYITAPTGTGNIGLYNGGTTTLVGALTAGLVTATSQTMNVAASAINWIQAGTGSTAFIDGYSGGAVATNHNLAFRAARGTQGTPTAVQLDDTLGWINFRGYGATGFAATARAAFRSFASENWTDTAQGTYFAIQTTPSGSTTMATIARFTDAGNVKIAGTALRATTEGTNHLDIFDGTAPVGTLANGCSLYSTAGELRVMDAAGNASLLSPHDKIDNAWIYHSKNTVTGKVLKIDMEKMMRALNEKLGGGFIHEWEE